MITYFNIPISDTSGYCNLNFRILSTALENHIERLADQIKEDPDNENLLEEQRASMLLSVDLVLTQGGAFLGHENKSLLN